MMARGSFSNTVRIEFPSLPDNVQFARTAIALFASQLDFTVDELEDIKVAVSEAVTNAVIHAYRDRIGSIVLEAKLTDNTLEITVEDRGCGIADVEQAREPTFTTASLEEHLGLGLTFVQELMDGMELESWPDQGTRVIMRKCLSAKAVQ